MPLSRQVRVAAFRLLCQRSVLQWSDLLKVTRDLPVGDRPTELLDLPATGGDEVVDELLTEQ